MTRGSPVVDMHKIFKELAELAKISMVSEARLQEFGELIVQECLSAVDHTDRRHGYTTFDLSLIDATIHRSKQSIINHFKDQNEGTVD